MDISVIIPTYKPTEYIRECLLSLRNQTLEKERFEILIILNGCNHPWYDYINNFIQTHLINYNIRLFQTDKGGVSNARNLGIENSSGSYIAFIDDDDYVSPNYLEGLLDVSDNNTVALSDSLSFIDGEEVFNENYSMHKTYIENYNKNNLTLMQVRHLLNGPCMKLIPREVIGNIRFNERFKNGEDSLFIYELTRNIKHINFANNQTIYYRRIRENSAVTRNVSLSYIWTNAFKLSFAQLGVFLSNFSKYEKYFTFVRIIATFKGAIYRTFHIV